MLWAYLEHLNNIRLFAQHEAASLASHFGQLPPLLEILLVPFVSMCCLCLLPVPLRKRDQGRDLLL